MSHYVFRAPIEGMVEVHVDGESLDDAVKNYMNGVGNAEDYPDYAISAGDVVGIDCVEHCCAPLIRH